MNHQTQEIALRYGGEAAIRRQSMCSWIKHLRLPTSGPRLNRCQHWHCAISPSFTSRDSPADMCQAQSKVVPHPSTLDSQNGSSSNVNKYLTGNFTPVRELQEGATSEGFLVLEGAIPSDLRGLFVMNGPNPDRNPNGSTYHLFDGDGMVHAVHFGREKMTYKNKFIDTLGRRVENLVSPGTKDAVYPATNEILENLPKALSLSSMSRSAPAWFFGLEQDSGQWRDTPFPVCTKNVANTNLVYHHGKLLALWEAGYPYELNLATLETIKPYTFKGRLTGGFSAHPKVDPVSEHMVDVSYNFPEAPHASVRVWNRKGDLINEMAIEGMDPVLMHDCAITEHYTLILDLPLLFSLPLGPGFGQRGNSGKIMSFKPERGGRIGAVPRFGAEEDIKWFEVSPNFVFHTFNAFEEGDRVIVHASRLDPEAGWDPMSGGFGGEKLLFQYSLDLKTGKAQERAAVSSGQSVDMPIIHPGFVGRKSNFIFVGGDPHPENYHPMTSCEKLDLLFGSPPLLYRLPEGCYVSTFTFAPRLPFGEGSCGAKKISDGSDEGWVLMLVYNGVTGFSELHVVDGRDMELVARVHLPSRIPYGFHSIFIPEENLPKPYSLV